MGTSEHAFLVLEGVHSFGQRYLIMGDLRAVNSRVFIDICYVTPSEFYNRTREFTATYKRCAQITREQLKALTQTMMESRNHQEMMRFSLMPRHDNEYNCIKWAMKMLQDAHIVDSAELHSWIPSREVSGRDCRIM